jgi:hypothetical protein
MNRIAVVVPALALAAALASAQQSGTFESFDVKDLSGAPVHIATAGKVTAVVFISQQCPVSNAYNERMTALYNAMSGKVQFVFLNANSTESAVVVAEHARRVGFTFPVYKDWDNIQADRLDAQFTPHAFVIGPDSRLVYHGGIDDAQNQARVTRNTLQEVLEAVSSGKAAPVSETKAFGCSIKRARKTT